MGMADDAQSMLADGAANRERHQAERHRESSARAAPMLAAYDRLCGWIDGLVAEFAEECRNNGVFNHSAAVIVPGPYRYEVGETTNFPAHTMREPEVRVFANGAWQWAKQDFIFKQLPLEPTRRQAERAAVYKAAYHNASPLEGYLPEIDFCLAMPLRMVRDGELARDDFYNEFVQSLASELARTRRQPPR
ncbi:hypothetical protein [Dactylosporangium sp. CA-139066]|uniref:hypothetical protein n=1 Tax=Dactylosporangium sp. CA-139066 TaxID=3239930 RepID=UPI003D8ED889